MDQKYIKEVVTLVDRELEETLEGIEWVMPFQKELIDSLDFYLAKNEVSLFQILKKANGIHVAEVKTNAWKALSNARIELIDYKRLSYLSAIDEQKEILKMKGTALSNFVYSSLNATGSEEKNVLKLMMLDVIGTEKAVRSQITAIRKFSKTSNINS